MSVNSLSTLVSSEFYLEPLQIKLFAAFTAEKQAKNKQVQMFMDRTHLHSKMSPMKCTENTGGGLKV